MRLNLSKTWGPVLALLVVTLAVFELTHLDLRVQDWFFDFDRGLWMVPRREMWGRVFFYTGPKVLIILFGVVVLTLLVGPPRWRERWRLNRRQLGVVILTLAIVPVFIGQLKHYTGVYCPWDIRRYGGPAPYVKVFEKHPADDRPDYAGRGFPAGHASGGFALFALISLARTRRQQWNALTLALVMGGMMGLYQMLKGAHYLSHTLVTMEVTWLIYLVLAAWIDPWWRHPAPLPTQPKRRCPTPS